MMGSVHFIESRVSFVVGILTFWLGAVVLIGWHTHVSFLITIDPAFEAMKYNTALGFLLSGLALALANVSYVGVARILGGFVGLMAFLTQMQNVFLLDFGIDQWATQDYIANTSTSPGRMSPITAVCFILTGSALFFATLATDRRWFMLVGILSTISLALGVMALFGYFADLEMAYRWGQYVRMAEHTAAGFTVLGVGIISLLWTREKAAGLPRWFPMAVVVFFSIIAFRLWQALDATEKHGILPETIMSLIFLMGLVIALAIDFAQRESLQIKEIFKLSHAIEQSPASVVITDKDGCIQYVNKRFCQLTGYAKEEVIGKNSRILKSGEQPREFYRDLWDTILSGKEWQGEFHNKKKNGELYWDNVSISSVKDERGEITHFVAVKEDITEKKRSLEALSESEERYRQFFATCSDAVILFDDETKRIVEANDATLKTYQYSREEFLALSISALSDDSVCCAQHIAETNEGQTHCVPLHFHKKKDGSLFPVEATQGAFTVKGRKVVFCIGRDISQRLENERKLRAAEKVAQTSEKLAGLGALAAGVCHETLNPLNIISMQVQMMLKHEKDNPVLVEKLLKITDEIKRIVKIMGTLMVFARKPSTDIRSVRINDELESALSLIEKDLLLSNVEVVRDYQDALPEIKIEPDEIRQVFLNLVNNARHAMKNGGKLTLTTRHVKTDAAGYLRISISDTGCGIKKENQAKIFEPFFTTKPEGEGTGIGLSMVFNIVEKHGGAVAVESEEGKGATFIIDLPVKKVEPDSRSILVTAVKPVAHALNGNSSCRNQTTCL